jgi:hypothetical protein
VIGLLKTQVKIFLHGLIVLAALGFAQVLLDIYQISFFMYSPPIGIAFFFMVSYIVQPLIIGALNVALIRKLYGLQDWHLEFWINGLFLMLVFTTINLIVQTMAILPVTISVTVVEVVLLAYPFGHLGRLSNG